MGSLSINLQSFQAGRLVLSINRLSILLLRPVVPSDGRRSRRHSRTLDPGIQNKVWGPGGIATACPVLSHAGRDTATNSLEGRWDARAIFAYRVRRSPCRPGGWRVQGWIRPWSVRWRYHGPGESRAERFQHRIDATPSSASVLASRSQSCSPVRGRGTVSSANRFQRVSRAATRRKAPG